MQFYQMQTADAYESLNTDEHGLFDEEVKERLQQHGLNPIKGKEGTSLWGILARQFTDPLVIILISALFLVEMVTWAIILGAGSMK